MLKNLKLTAVYLPTDLSSVVLLRPCNSGDKTRLVPLSLKLTTVDLEVSTMCKPGSTIGAELRVMALNQRARLKAGSTRITVASIPCAFTPEGKTCQ